jgi:mRNA-decapping enzyme 1B
MPPPPPQPNGGKVTPNLAMDAEATRMLNLTVLQRLDPAVEDILITAAHVTLYDFNIDLNQWVSTPSRHQTCPIQSIWLTRGYTF